MVFIFSWPKLIQYAFQSDDLASTDKSKTTDYSGRYEVQAPLILK